MARMYPNRPAETQSNAEVILYHQLARQLPDEYVVFHSVKWVLRDSSKGAQDGEADFVIAHPEYGLLVIEVKGGFIQIDGITGIWRSNQYDIKNPFSQAKKNKYSLLQKLKEMPFWHDRHLAIGHAVALPDAELPSNLGMDAPREICLGRKELPSLHEWICQVFQYWGGDQLQQPIGQQGIRQLVDLFTPSRELRAPLAVAFADEYQAMIRLTEEQYELLEFLNGQRRVAIRGCAGSGKSTLAIEQARRLVNQGFRVLLVCFNKNLAAYLRADEVLANEIDIYHFHGLCLEVSKQAGIRVPTTQASSEQFFHETLPEMLLAAIEEMGAQYDAIIVDEGQDFRPSWWFPLQCLMHDQDAGAFYVFYDDNQNLYGNSLEGLHQMNSYSLSTNLRNTQLIHKTFVQFYKGSREPKAKGPDGRVPVLYSYTSEQELRRRLGAILQQLITKEKIDTDKIAILTQSSAPNSDLQPNITVGSWDITWQWPPGSGEVYVTTVHQFKGLESPVVILAEIKDRKSVV